METITYATLKQETNTIIRKLLLAVEIAGAECCMLRRGVPLLVVNMYDFDLFPLLTERNKRGRKLNPINCDSCEHPENCNTECPYFDPVSDIWEGDERTAAFVMKELILERLYTLYAVDNSDEERVTIKREISQVMGDAIQREAESAAKGITKLKGAICDKVEEREQQEEAERQLQEDREGATLFESEDERYWF